MLRDKEAYDELLNVLKLHSSHLDVQKLGLHILKTQVAHAGMTIKAVHSFFQLYL